MESLCLGTGIQVIASTISMNGGGGGLDVRTASSSSQVRAPVAPKTTSLLSSRFSFKYPLRYFWPGGGQRCSSIAVDDTVTVEKPEHVLGCDEDGEDGKLMDSQVQNGSWVLKILHANKGVQELGKKEEISSVANGDDDDDEKCDVCRVDDGNKEQDEIKFDRDSFSRLLRKVPLAEAKLYAKLSYLGDLTYSVSKIQPENLLRYYRLQFVTSSLEKRELLAKAEKGEISDDVKEEKSEEKVAGKNKNNGYHISASTAYQIAASAASYLHSQTRSIIPFKSSEDKSTTNEECVNNRVSVNTLSSNMASLMATTDSVTAVVAAKEDVKQAVADDLNSISSSPCEWFICDDEQSGTRFFVIQGSESLASWQANLLFEPIQFEGLDVLVHRGIYEAARGIYEQMLPEVRAHMQSQGERATFRFTGHSLGGSLALLINLMLLIRGEVPLSSLLPVVTFGAPYVMCGGDHLLNQLGLPKNHFQSIALHRDIVPRAFSAHLSNHIVELLKAVNGKLRTHPCLNNQRYLYAPMGELLILQPDDKYSPHHDLLPHGSGLYLLNCPNSNGNETEKLLKAATKVFLNQPHPLEILSDRGAYGSEGTIVRDHDMKSYLKSIRGVIRQDLNKIRKAKRERRRKVWWPLVSARHIHHAGFNAVQSMAMNHMDQQHNHFNFSGILQTGRDSFKRFSRLVASQHMHLLVVLLFPARLLLFGTYNVTLP